MKKHRSLSMIPVLVILCVTFGWTYFVDPIHAQTDATSQSGAANQSDAAGAMICPKCKGQMEAGVVLDYYGNQFDQSQWAPGNPHWRVFGRMPTTKKVYTYRCTNCGYLESYAK